MKRREKEVWEGEGKIFLEMLYKLPYSASVVVRSTILTFEGRGEDPRPRFAKHRWQQQSTTTTTTSVLSACLSVVVSPRRSAQVGASYCCCLFSRWS
jgi:hypothetical protein